MEILGSLPVLQEANPRLVLRLIREAGSISRAELARLTGLHPSTITRITAALIEAGLVQEMGEGQNDLGRKPIALRLVPEAVHVLGVAVETTFVAGVLVNLGAQITARAEVAYVPDEGKTPIQEKILAVIEELLREAGRRGIQVAGIGVAMHGMVDSQRGVSLFAPAIGWRNVPLAELIGEHCGLPVRMENNARAMVLGEYWFGSGRGVQHLLGVKVGQSIGSGIILGGQPFTGAGFSSGEIGHTTVVPDGSLCKCGNYGCLETVASIEAVLKKMRVILKRGDGGSLLELVDTDPDHLTFHHLVEATRQGHPLAVQLWEEAVSYLGAAIANTINILNPAKVLIGGDILPVIDYLLPKIREIVEARILHVAQPSLAIEPVGLGADSVTVGAATLVLRELFA